MTMDDWPEALRQAMQLDELSDERWELVELLQTEADPDLLQTLLEMLRSGERSKKRLASDVLAMSVFAPRSEVVLAARSELTKLDLDPWVTASMIHALGRGDDRSSRDLIASFANSDDEDVREAVAFWLPHLEAAITSSTIDLLLEFANDSVEDVRSQAILALAHQYDLQEPAIVNALLVAATDLSAEVRGEALVGLAWRKHPQASALIEAALTDSSFTSDSALLAAAIMGDSTLLPALRALEGREELDEGRLREAIAACASGKGYPIPRELRDKSSGVARKSE